MAENLDRVLERHEATEAERIAKEEGALDAELNKTPFQDAADWLKDHPARPDLLGLMKPGVKKAPPSTQLEGILLDFPTYEDFVKGAEYQKALVDGATIINVRAVMQPLYESLKKKGGEPESPKPWYKRIVGV